MTDTHYPLISLPEEIRAYCKRNELTHKQFAHLCGLSVSFIDKVIIDYDPIYIRRIGNISQILTALGFTMEDFDPRITEENIKRACITIRRMRDRGCKATPIASFLGMDGGSGTLAACLSSFAQGRYGSMGYDKAICLSHALEPEFEQWCTLYAKRISDAEEFIRLGGHDRRNVAPQRPKQERAIPRQGAHLPDEQEYTPENFAEAPTYILNMKRKDVLKMVEKSINAKLSDNLDARQAQMFSLMKSIGFEPFINFCTYTEHPDSPVITWETDSGLYRCEMTWNTFKAWFRQKDGTEVLSSDRDIRPWHTLSNYDMAYFCAD